MKKILWLCSMVLPEFAQEFAIKRKHTGGWMTGMLNTLETRDGINISLCFPIYDINRLKDGCCNGHNYYTFHCKSTEFYDAEMIESFEHILEKSKPDIIHLWGVEFSFSAAMLQACKNKGMLSRAVANIQGLTSVYAKHYYADIPAEYISLKCGDKRSIEEGKIAYEKRGKCEIESIRMIQHVIGRTDWDRACVEAINPLIHYYFCDEVLRNIFYEYAGRWKYDNCEKYSIFVSQAYYPIKGFHYLLQALPIILRKYPGTRVYVAGLNIFDEKELGSYALYLEELMELFELKKHITFVGKLDAEQMIQQFLKTNVFVSASIIENSSNSLNEAMLIGTPTVASYVGGTNNRMTSGLDGYLYPHNEPVLLAYYVCKVFENENDVCARFSDNSVKKMLRFIDPESNADRTMEIYREVIKNVMRIDAEKTAT